VEEQIIILTDNREQQPYTFTRWPEVTVEKTTLTTGDYTLKAMDHLIAIERKSVDDLISCLMGANRERFSKELSRGSNIPHFYVLIEASMEDVARHRYLSHMAPHAVLSSILALSIRWRTNFMFCGSRAAAEYTAFNLLRLFLREVEQAYLDASKAGHNLKQPTKKRGK
jgi:DNA excision repair protein ERCC-4